METPLLQIAQAGFILLTVVCVVLFIREFFKAVRLTGWENKRKKKFNTKLVVTAVVWAGFISAWSLSGKMADFSLFPFNILPVIVIPVITAIFFIPSRATGEVLNHIPASNIIRLQSFRFFVEVLLWMLFVASMLPVQMTFEGRNFDILAGFSAPVIAALAAKHIIAKKGIVIWNIVCLGLLLNIVTVAILSTPSPWRVFMNDPANYIVTWFPISLLPGILVPLAYYLHFLSLRQAVMRPDRQRPQL